MTMNHIATAMLGSMMLAGVVHAAEITIYKQPHFSGDGVTVRNDARDLGPLGITDQASSLVVKSGRWQVCTQPDFQGDCQVLRQGEYATLDPTLNHRIESVREVERTARGTRDGRSESRSPEAYGERGPEGRFERPERRPETPRWRDDERAPGSGEWR
jgi:hypothetical protein